MKIVNVHASCVALGTKGVLIFGDSGAGKSDLALRLIDGGAKLVADDRTELFVSRGRLCARAPKTIAGLIEVRGLGIVALPSAGHATIALAVKLGMPSKRLPETALFQPPAPLRPVQCPPVIVLDSAMASAPARIRLALTAFRKGLLRDNFNPT
jgi:HPr kinase/phosphorylase